ncbi:MAG TPA: DUF1844 domain-containing protein [Thermoanaerobaculia bacterium]|nr:DUF1844 domain-containing protein [Thermoanaerobaculia bacterium]
MIPQDIGREAHLPTDKQPPKEMKVTDKRIFTPDGDIRDEFKEDIKPADPQPAAAAPPPQAEATAAPPAPEERRQKNEPPPGGEDRRRTLRDKAENPATPFTNFIEPLIAQAYMSLGLLRNPYQPQAKIDVAAARQMIEILTLLKEKTAGNLTADEEDFLSTHLGELKLAFVQRTKSI